MEPINEFIDRKNIEYKKNNVIKVKDIGRKGKIFFIREAWTFYQQSNLDKKVFIIERLRKDQKQGSIAYKNWKKGDIEYRIGYYIVGQIGRAKDRWIWGQFCPLIPQNDFNGLIDKAKKEKVIL